MQDFLLEMQLVNLADVLRAPSSPISWLSSYYLFKRLPDNLEISQRGKQEKNAEEQTAIKETKTKQHKQGNHKANMLEEEK